MSAETFSTALFLITAVIAAGVLINAVFPVVYTMAGTFSASSHESDQRLRTDFKIVTATVGTDNVARMWMKNIGSTRISVGEIERSDVFCGYIGDFDRLSYGDAVIQGTWKADLSDLNTNSYWDPGETLKVTAKPVNFIPADGDGVYFQFVLPDGIWRETEFTVG